MLPHFRLWRWGILFANSVSKRAAPMEFRKQDHRNCFDVLASSIERRAWSNCGMREVCISSRALT
jgi:hypothetical protein